MCGHGPMLAGSSCTQRTSSRFGYFAELRLELVDRPRVELLDPDDRGRRLVALALLALDHQVPGDPARAQQHLAHRRRVVDRVVADHRPEVPSVKSSGCEAASLRLSIDFGVKTISGRCSSPSECWRSRWKWLRRGRRLRDRERVVGASVRNRSIRAEEWSGPWPS